MRGWLMGDSEVWFFGFWFGDGMGLEMGYLNWVGMGGWGWGWGFWFDFGGCGIVK